MGNRFFTWDTTIMQWLSADSREARARAMNGVNGGEAADSYGTILDITDALDTSVEARVAAVRAEATEVRTTSTRVLGAALLLALALAFTLSTWVTRSVVRPLATVVAALHKLAQRDLTARADIGSRDELGRLGEALNTTAGSLRDTVAAIAGHAGTLSSASEALTQASTRIATTIAGVAAAVGSTTSGVDEAHRSAQQLAETSGELYRIVGGFRL